MEEDLKMLKVESFSKHLSDLSQILNLTLGDQTEIKRCKKYHQWKKTSKIYIKKEDLSRHCLDLAQILNLSLGGQI